MAQAYWLQNGIPCAGSVADFLPLSMREQRVIALVGGGGKTTLAYALADSFCRLGRRVAVTTTTHMQRPEHCPVCTSLAACEQRWTQGEYAFWAEDCGGEKLTGLSEESFSSLAARAEIVLVEADGAKRLPCKAPAAHEPVIPPQADLVIAVLGLDALGQPVDDVCFRSDAVMRLLQCSLTHRLLPSDFATLLLSPQGLRKHVHQRQYGVILNKCDTPERFALGQEVLHLLHTQGHSLAALSCCLEQESFPW